MSPPNTVNVAAHLSALAAREPDRAAVILPRFRADGVDTAQLTFGELDRLSGQLARGLDRVGIVRGVRTVLMVPPSLDFFSLTFALFKVGAVPVLVDPGMGVLKLGKCLAEAAPEAFVGVPKAHVARRALRWARKSIRVTVTTGRRLFGGKYRLGQLRRVGEILGPLPAAETRADETAAILFTSGSTGVAKGAVYTHGIFAAQVESLKAVYGIEPGEIDLCTFPLFALFAPALGMTAVIPEMDPTRPARVDPTKVIRAVEHFGVTNLFGSPALLNRVGRYGVELRVKLPTLRRAISAGAPVPAGVIERFAAMLSPGVQVFTPYGATEALPVANIGSEAVLNETRSLTDQGRGVCVGRPVPGMDVRIIAISDDPVPTFDEGLCLPPGDVGEIAVCGPVVTAEYVGRPQATALAKMRDASGRLWHRMGDVGYFDERGRLWFCGRKSHRVITPDGTLFTDQVEPVFNSAPGVCRTALIGVASRGVTHPVIAVELDDDAPGIDPWPEVYEALRAAARGHEHTRRIEVFLEHPGTFPVDVRHNSKIFREQLVPWAASEMDWRRLPPEPAPTGAAE
ncbi:MAG TPA: fatty acid CoA ligase family protein [Gemmataceae bacterium]|nr:fatty acid CoA ligase family protein [Gemmataceae bacterium]